MLCEYIPLQSKVEHEAKYGTANEKLHTRRIVTCCNQRAKQEEEETLLEVLHDRTIAVVQR